MILDTTHHPLVYLHYHAKPDVDAMLVQFSQLLAREQAFVLIADGWPADTHNEEESATHRRKITVWTKANKPALQQLVKGQVQIATDPAQAKAVQAFAPIFAKVWGFALFVADNADAAHARAQTLLAQPVEHAA